MTKMIHLAAQYLATAGISFLDKKDDDSHTNLGFDAQKGFLETWPLNEEGNKIVLDYLQFSLHWVSNDAVRTTLLLDGKTHGEIVNWLTELTKGLSPDRVYKYDLHYDLPYDRITDDFVFSKPSQEQLGKMLGYRRIALHAMQNVVYAMNLSTPIRVWPHHFDIGGYETINSGKNIGVGFGMAIPDTMIDDFYLYASGYRGHEGIDTSKFSALSNGEWRNDGFKGAVLPMEKVDEARATAFFNESIAEYRSL
ncbi:hypothetical protein [Pseudozobellia thermophila]|uniref:Uncharacterized protein n=1 Tax=Pseudozobellia thermophila TaxID=192903 RepID=A0A1M6GB23_9FLAO|nr:hypothetical protein [Pseudozobellia thermophila]SHJ07135.1 hypothetical protein SAMN04488513_102745 [Pseudozobellia thermophila]